MSELPFCAYGQRDVSPRMVRLDVDDVTRLVEASDDVGDLQSAAIHKLLRQSEMVNHLMNPNEGAMSFSLLKLDSGM